jgi:hypothetical protein
METKEKPRPPFDAAPLTCWERVAKHNHLGDGHVLGRARWSSAVVGDEMSFSVADLAGRSAGL